MRRDFGIENTLILAGLAGKMAVEMVDAVRGKLAAIVAPVVRLYELIDAAQGSGTLTPIGLNERKRTLGAEARKALRQLRTSILTPLDDNIAQKQASMLQPADKSENPIVEYLRASEIRNSLRDVDPLALRVRYAEACEGGQIEFCRAVENSPIPLLASEVITEGRAMQIRKANAAAADELDRLVLLKKIYAGQLTSADAAVIDECGPDMTADDPIVAAASAKS